MLHIVKGPYIIQSCNMVAMGMRYQYGVYVVYLFAQHLLAEIRPDIEEDVFVADR